MLHAVLLNYEYLCLKQPTINNSIRRRYSAKMAPNGLLNRNVEWKAICTHLHINSYTKVCTYTYAGFVVLMALCCMFLPYIYTFVHCRFIPQRLNF